MFTVWVVALLLPLSPAFAPAHAQDESVGLDAPVRAQEPSPLVPHPTNRPRYSQDKYKPLRPPPDIPPPVYQQDKYARPEEIPDYSDELRGVPEKGREWSEIEIATGLAALNRNELDVAQKHFEKAFAKDPVNFVALEYMAALSERRGDLRGGIAWLAKAKHLAPKAHWGMINFQIGRLYLMLKNYERAEIYLRLSLDQGAQQTAANYTLGYLLYIEERYFEAEKYLHEARMRGMRRTARQPERELLQAINYYLGEVYARLGFTRYAVAMLRQTELGDSWELRNGAWRVHSELNRPSWYITLGSFAQYDSNVLLLPINTGLPIVYTSQAAVGGLVTANGGWQSSPAKPWSFGVDGSFYVNQHFNSTLKEFDVLNFSGDGWVTWWNQRDWSFSVRYDLNHALTNSSSYTTFQTTHGPQISANYSPFQRWNWEAGMAYRYNSFPGDDLAGPNRRSGHTYVGFAKASLKAPNPRLRPTFGYTFEADATEGENFQSRAHIFQLEADWRLFSKTHLIAGVGLSLLDYPNHLTGRKDTIRQARLALNQIFSPHWVGIFDLTQITETSTDNQFAYGRVIVTGGVTYTF